MKTSSCIIVSACLAVLSGSAYSIDRLVPSQYPTIQAAIDASNVGDVVLVSAGSHAGPIDTKGKAITIRGATDPTTVLVVGGQSVLRCVTGEGPKTIVEGLTLTGGSGAFGGGIRIIGSSPTIRGCRVTGNALAGPGFCFGGGVAIENGSPLIEDCLIGGNLVLPPIVNTGQYYCGIQNFAVRGEGGGVYINGGSPTLRDCNISGNEVRCVGGASNAYCRQAYGGGIYKLGNGQLVVENCVVAGNLLQLQGGGVYYEPGAAACASWIEPPAIIRGSRFSQNRGGGTGLYLLNPGVTLTTSVVCDNDGGNLNGPFIDGGGNRIGTNCASCTGDVNGDGRVDGVDIATVLGAWGQCP